MIEDSCRVATSVNDALTLAANDQSSKETVENYIEDYPESQMWCQVLTNRPTIGLLRKLAAGSLRKS